MQRVAPQQGAQGLAGIVFQRQLEAATGVIQVFHRKTSKQAVTRPDHNDALATRE
jgi:hypothetical protein